MKVATILLAGALFVSPALAQAQTASGAGGGKPMRSDLLKAGHGPSAQPARNGNDTDRVIDQELNRIDHMMTICTGC